MITTALLILLLFGSPASGTVLPSAAARQDGYPLASPFTAVRMNGEVAEVRYRERWYELVSLDGIATGRILDHARDAFGPIWEKRFAEDLVQVLDGMGHEVGDAVALELVDPETRAPLRVPKAAMTHENRQAVWKDRQARERGRGEAEPPRFGDSRPRVERVRREHARTPDPTYGFLAEASRLSWPRSEPRIARARAEQDLDELELLIRERFSYRDVGGIAWDAALDAIRCGLPEEIARADLALRIARLLALSVDGHSGLDEDLGGLAPGGCTPFLVGDLGSALVAFTPARDAFLDAEHPCLVGLDGLPIERWIAAAASLVVRGSPSMARYRALRLLRHANLLRAELGLEPRESIEVELASLDGTQRMHQRLALSERKPLYGEWPRGESRRIADDVGYLRLARMDDGASFLDGIDAAMASFRGMRALVVDVRGNGGGSRDALLRLFPYFLREGDGPHVANAAVLRLERGQPRAEPEGFLEDRFLWPASSLRFGASEREAIARAQAAFHPSWTPAPEEFSDWHWLVLSRATNPRAYSFEGEVIVLLDGGCFSATDVFLAALQGWHDVTLLGTPSGGGSGRARSFRLAESGIGVRLSSMASFRIDGCAYDGVGIAPDLLVYPAPGDFIGLGDAQLEAALARPRD